MIMRGKGDEESDIEQARRCFNEAAHDHARKACGRSGNLQTWP